MKWRVDEQLVLALFNKIFFFSKETLTVAVYCSNLAIYTNKPFVSNLICLLTYSLHGAESFLSS